MPGNNLSLEKRVRFIEKELEEIGPPMGSFYDQIIVIYEQITALNKRIRQLEKKVGIKPGRLLTYRQLNRHQQELTRKARQFQRRRKS